MWSPPTNHRVRPVVPVGKEETQFCKDNEREKQALLRVEVITDMQQKVSESGSWTWMFVIGWIQILLVQVPR